MNIAFCVRHFSERGTEIATFDYAHYNEVILHNKSYIISYIHNSDDSVNTFTYDTFSSRFEILTIKDISEMKDIIKQYNIHFFYTLTFGGYGDVYQFENKDIWGNCKTIKHCVFETTSPESDYYISISSFLNQKNNTNLPVIPHIVSLPDCSDNLRDDLNIPKDAIVFGRYGGFDEFNIDIAHNAIKSFLNTKPHAYFIFINTIPFLHHPKIIYMGKTRDKLRKVKFINTCDAMIHARDMGETFGLSIAEFSSKNKPIITCPRGDLEHIRLLGNKAILYENERELVNIFKNIKEIISLRKNWNAYQSFSPSNIMQQFDSLIFSQSETSI